MKVFADYLAAIGDPQQRARTAEVLDWVAARFPQLAPRIAWNQPMFTDHGTFIIGFSVAKHHLAVAPERAGILQFSEDIARAGYEHSKQLVRIKWDKPLDFSLLEKMIAFNVRDKADCASFWR
ncbi:MAG: iron chaperone [Massilia sp.]